MLRAERMVFDRLKDGERGRGRSGGTGPAVRLPGWIVPAVAVAVALALAFAVDALYDNLQRDEEARILLARLSEDALEQQGAWREVGERGEASGEILGEVSEERRDLGQGLAEFGRLDDGGREVPIREALAEAERAFDEEVRLAGEGRAAEAAALREGRTRPAFERLDELLDEAAGDYEGIAARTERIASLGTYAAILLAAAALVALFLRYERSRRAAGREIERSRERYALAVRGANDGLWDWDLASGEVYFSPRWKEMLGYGDDEFPNRYEEWERRIHPEDLPAVREAIGKHLEGETAYYGAEYRLKHRDGLYRWVLARGASVRDAEGKPYRMAGSHTDVAERREAEEKLRESQRGLADAQRISHVGNWSYGIAEDEAAWSDELFRIFGLVPGELTPRYGSFLRFVHRDDKTLVRRAVREALYGEPPPEIEFRVVRPTGEKRFVRALYEVIRGTEGPVRIVGTVQDVTERREAEEKLREAERRYRTLIEQIPVVTYVQNVGRDHATTYISPQLRDLVGYATEEYVSDPDLRRSILHPEDRDRVLAEDERTDRTGEPFRMEYRMISRDGRVVWVRDEAVIVRGEGGEPLHWRGVMLDITESKTLESTLAHRAFHDPLTGLPNRALFADRLAHALARLDRETTADGRGTAPVAVLMVDLDNFKYVNDSLGHDAGDELLVAVARRLKGCVRPADTVARLGGDEFTVLLEDLGGVREAAVVAERVLAAFARPFAVGGQEIFVTTSVGVAPGGPETDGPEDLLRAADIAMYGAKRKGKAKYEIFDASMGAEAQARLGLENDLRRAVGNGGEEFAVLYQPKVRLKTGALFGFEALARWEHPERGLVGPDRFIPLAEETGLIVEVGRAVLREACRQARVWQDAQPLAPPVVGVNLSARQFGDPGIVEDVGAALAETGLRPTSLVLEVTESAVMEDAPAAAGTLAALKSLGVEIAVDDFGTGYSSLAYLKHFPVDYLKIDRSFVERIGDPDVEAIVSAMTDLAGTLGLRVIAEGVETEEWRAKLESLGCELAQGFLFSEPLAALDATRVLRDGGPLGPKRG